MPTAPQVLVIANPSPCSHGVWMIGALDSERIAAVPRHNEIRPPPEVNARDRVARWLTNASHTRSHTFGRRYWGLKILPALAFSG